jgi:ribokinase
VQPTPGELTGTATIPVEASGGQNLIVVVPGANAALTPADVDVPAVREAAVVLLQLENPLDTVRAAATAAGGTVVLNPAPAQPLPADVLRLVDVLVPNEHELLRLTGADGGDRSLTELAALCRQLGAGGVVVTLGARGALVVPATGTALLQAPPHVSPVDTTGAGDCFCGALAQALAGGAELPAAVRSAVAAAASSTTGAGARGALPDRATVQDLLSRTPAATPVDAPARGTVAQPRRGEGPRA